MRAVRLALAVVSVLAVLVAGMGLAYAAGRGDTVGACVDKKGNLRLANAKGKCPKRTSKVALGQQGPAGATGPAGPQGVAGPQGPGMVSFRNTRSTDSLNSPAPLGGVAGWTAGQRCFSTGLSSSTTLSITPPTGTTVSYAALVATLSGTTADQRTMSGSSATQASFTWSFGSEAGWLNTGPVLLTASDGSRLLLTATLTAQNTTCTVSGTLTPVA